jgi:hypothetical protein
VPTAAPARRSRRRASTAEVTAGAYSRWRPPRRPPEPSRPGGASRRDHRRPRRAGHARASRVSRLAEAGSAGSAKSLFPVCSPRAFGDPFPRTTKAPHYQGSRRIGETGFEPATARPPAGAIQFCQAAHGAVGRCELF